MSCFVSKSNVFVQCNQFSPTDLRTFDSNELDVVNQNHTVQTV